ncbi:MAG: hypothetical protein OEV44_09355, partial [Spirochaetota bacterium]|nr:hypothetical protein [Spirochaetota bacterium]
RGSTGEKIIEKKVLVGETEHEYFYKDKSGALPKEGKCYIQYYRSPEKVTLIINNRITADVLLDGVEPANKDYTEEFFWEVYNQFIFQKKQLTYKIIGERTADGMHKVEIFAGKASLNKFVNKYCRVRYLPPAGYYPEPVWKHKKGSAWLPARYKKADAKAAAPKKDEAAAPAPAKKAKKEPKIKKK